MTAHDLAYDLLSRPDSPIFVDWCGHPREVRVRVEGDGLIPDRVVLCPNRDKQR